MRKKLSSPLVHQARQLEALFNAKNFSVLEEKSLAIVRAYPLHALGWKALGIAQHYLGKPEQALISKRKAVELSPNDAEAISNLGCTLWELKQLSEAEIYLKRAIQINPDIHEAYVNLASVLYELGRVEESKLCCQKALTLKPDDAAAHNNMGNVHKDFRRLEDARRCYEKAISLNPKLFISHLNLGRVYEEMGYPKKAVASYEVAAKLSGGQFKSELLSKLVLPKIPQSKDEINHWRGIFNRSLDELMDCQISDTEPSPVDSNQTFNLAYHGECNRSLMEKVYALFNAKIPLLSFSGVRDSKLSRCDFDKKRIRIAFISQFLVGHTIGKLFQGCIKQLDRSCFEVILIHSERTKKDVFSAFLESQVDATVTLNGSIQDQQIFISNLDLDVIVYPDIGMSPATYFLAYSRLAPVQVVCWGHPDTTGIESIDYFLSAENIETSDSQSHYSERLICLSRLPCYYEPLSAPTKIPNKISLGLPAQGTLYVCPQSLFKIHPDFDAILNDIIRLDPDGHIIMLEGGVPEWVDLLRQRWAINFPLLNSKVIFLPSLNLDKFMAMLAHSDVLLDPVHFGSGNTLYEGMVYGIPVVTWPGKFMRGRIVAGAYAQMGILNPPVAENMDEYASIAVRVGLDDEVRNSLRKQLLVATVKLFSDIGAVKEFECFVTAALAAAQMNEKLPIGWKPARYLND